MHFSGAGRIRQFAACGAAAVVIAGITAGVAGVTAIAAGAATLPAEYSANIHPTSVMSGTPTGFGMTILNEAPFNSGDVIDQVTVSVPSNYGSISASNQGGWAASTSGHTVTFSKSLGLGPGGSMTFTVGATGTTIGTSAWTTTASGVINGLLGNSAFSYDSANSNTTVTVTPGAPTSMTVAAPASVTAGAGFTVTATLYDANHNVATEFGGPVTLNFATGSPMSGGAPPLPTSSNANAGVASFSLDLTRAGSGYVLQGSEGAVVGQSAPVSVVPGPPANVVVAAPSQATAATPFTVTATISDQFGNLTNGTGSASLAFAPSSPTSATTPSLPTTATPANGVAHFSVAVAKAASGYVLRATSNSVSGDSGPISVVPGVPASVVVSAPGSVSAGSPFTVSATLYDAGGNIVTNATQPVSFAFASGSPTSPTSPTLPASATPSNGVASLTLSIANVNQSGYKLQGSSGAASGTSGPIVVFNNVTACSTNATNPYHCTTPAVGSPTNTTLQVDTFGTGNEVITVDVGGAVQAPPCAASGSYGQPSSEHNQNSSRTVTLTLTVAVPQSTPGGFGVCYEASHPFTTASGLPAVSNGSNSFYGDLPLCTANGNTAPCITSMTRLDVSGSHTVDDGVQAIINGLSGDPVPILVPGGIRV